MSDTQPAHPLDSATHEPVIEPATAVSSVEQRLRSQNRTLLVLARSEALSAGDLLAAIRQITEAAAKTAGTARVSVWLLDEPGEHIECLDLYELALDRHSSGYRLKVADYPDYFAALEQVRIMAAPDARNDPLTREFTERYFSDLGIASILDAPVRVDGRTVGVLWLEHVGALRNWPTEDQHFAGSIADFVALAIQAEHRRRGQEALVRAEQKYRGIFEQSVQGIYQSALEGHFETANPMMAVLLGYDSPEQLIQTLTHLDRHYVDPGRRAEFIRLVNRNGVVSGFESQVYRRDGRVIWISENARVVRDRAGNPTGFEGTIEDVTDRKQSEEALKSRLAFVDLITQISTHFINMDPSRIDDGIRYALRTIGAFTAVDRSGVFLFTEDGRHIDNTHEWCAAGIESRSAERQTLAVERLPWVTPQTLAGAVVQVADVQAMPQEAAGERRRFEADGAHSLLFVPLGTGHAHSGFLAFESIRSTKTWNDDDIGLLKVVGEILVNALERKRGDEALRESQRTLSTLMSNLPGMVYRCRNDRNWSMEFVSEGCYSLTGHQPDELVHNRQATFADLIHPNDREQVWNRVQGAVQAHRPFELHYRIRAADGTERWVWEQGRGVFSPSGELLALEGFISDITERKRVEHQLKDHQEFLRRIIDLNPNYIFAKDRAGRYTLVNQAVADAYGTTVDALLGKTDAEYSPNRSEADRFRQDDLEVMNSGKEKVIAEEHITLRSGEVRVLQTTKIPLLNARGEADQVLGVATDLTEYKKAEERNRQLQAQLFHAQKMESIGLLAGGVAHDFNNLLAGIMGFASLARDHIDRNHRAAEYLDLIMQSGEQAAKLTRELLAYAQGGLQVREVIDLDRQINEMINLVRINLPKGATLERPVGSEPLIIQADPAQIQQVVMNLCINACEALGGAGGTIVVRSGRQTITEAYQNPQQRHVPAGDYVYFEVDDNGCGISEALSGRIFEPFFSTKRFGRGMGLAAVMGIISNHNGDIQVHSRPGQGTRFRVLVPRCESPLPAPPPDTAAQAGGPETVLVVDDEELVRKVAKTCLEKEGYSVVTASSGHEAIELFRARGSTIDVVLLDVVMPDLNGAEVLTQLRSIRPQVKALVSSGYSEAAASAQIGQVEVAGFVQKPYTMQALCSAIRQALDRGSR